MVGVDRERTDLFLMCEQRLCHCNSIAGMFVWEGSSEAGNKEFLSPAMHS